LPVVFDFLLGLIIRRQMHADNKTFFASFEIGVASRMLGAPTDNR
jgi:hypothetical protein